MKTRRAFLKKAGLLAGSIAVLPHTLHACEKTDKKLGVCLVGLGNYSENLLAPALRLTRYCDLRGIVTGSPWKIPIWQKRYGIPDANVYNYETIGKIADNPDIDVIYIVLPTGLHAEYAIKAAGTGKHVWCEKPMAKTVAECQEIIAACAKNRVKLSIGYRMQHEPNTQQVISWAASRPYGPINTVQAEIGFAISNPGNTWRMRKDLGGGLLYDVGVYAINGMRYVTGKEPLSVVARYENTRPDVYKEVPETTIFDFEFPEGIKAHGRTTGKESINILRAECEQGWYELSPFQSYSGVKGRAGDGRPLTAYIENQQAKQMDDDALAILEDTPVLVPGEDGMQDIALVEAIIKAAETAKKVTIA